MVHVRNFLALRMKIRCLKSRALQCRVSQKVSHFQIRTTSEIFGLEHFGKLKDTVNNAVIYKVFEKLKKWREIEPILPAEVAFQIYSSFEMHWFSL